MEIVENSRERLHLKYSTKWSIFIFSLFPTLILISSLFFVDNGFNINCVKNEHDNVGFDAGDLCHVTKTTLVGSSTLAKSILPSFLTGSDFTFELSDVVAFRVETIVSKSTSDSTGYTTESYKYNTVMYRELTPEERLADVGYHGSGDSEEQYQYYAVTLFDAGSDYDAAALLKQKLDKFFNGAKTSTNTVLFSHSLDDSVWQEVLCVISICALIFIFFFISANETINIDAETRSIRITRTSITGRIKMLEVIPIRSYVKCTIHERVSTNRDNEIQRSYYSQMIYSPGAADPDDQRNTSINLFCNQDLGSRAGAEGSIHVIDGWIREYRQSVQRREERERNNMYSAIQQALSPGASSEDSPSLIQRRAQATVSDDNGNAKKCCVCWDDEKEIKTVFLPCKHMICCEDCADQVTQCPLCRVLINSTINVYQ